MSLAYALMESPVGRLKLVASDAGVVAIFWDNERQGRVKFTEALEPRKHPLLKQAERELQEYFAGERTEFSLPLDMRGTAFQKDVWEALLGIPFGETRSYGALAKQLGNANAMRAVGAANGRNPISIVVPCHRVIGATGKLTGFGGGLNAKEFLLEHEGRDRRLF